MESSKRFWRGLFFISLITAICGGLVLPTASVRAAPGYQLACGLVMAQWTFDPTPVSTTAPLPTTANVVASATQSGVGNIGFQTTGAHSGNAWSGNSWSQTSTPIAYFEFDVGTVGYTGIAASFWVSSSGTGPQNVSFQYSIDGSAFTQFNTYPITVNTSSAQINIDLSSVTALDNNANAKFRIYGINATGPGTGGVLRVDDVTFTGCQPATPTPTPTETGTPTNTPIATNTGTPTPTGTVTPTRTPTFTPTPTNTPSTGSATSIVISEFRTTGPGGANDEFIELYNPTSNYIDISGWIISGSNKDGGTQTRTTIPASTILRAGQYYLIANNSYSNTSVTADLKYSTSIADDGGIGLFRTDNTLADEVGMSTGSAYQEGTPLSPLTNANRSYERLEGDGSSSGIRGSCQDTNDNANDFSERTPTPHNTLTIRFCNGTAGPALSTTTTTITSDSPDPSLVNQNVSVSVRVAGGTVTPSGKVNITGANTNCSITLNSAGTGSCIVKFTSTGTKGLIATYLGDNTHASSTDSEPHSVSTTTTILTPTPRPTPLPPPPLIGINEFVPRPGHDWNNDGVINAGDEYIEIINHGVIDVSLGGYSLDDEVNVGSPPYSLPGTITLKPGERHVFYGSETGLLLSDGGDGVRLLKPNGQLGDAYNYFVVRFPDQSYCRLPDNGGLDDWNQNCFPTPGLQNSLSGTTVNPPTQGGEQTLCPISDTLPNDFVFAECFPFGNNIWNAEYWDKFGWFDEKYLPKSPGKWPVFAE